MTDTQSVLDLMTQGIMTRKEAKAATLTPVGLEGALSVQKRDLRDLKGDVFPYDGGISETAVQSIAEVRRQLRFIEDCLASIERECAPPLIGPLTTDLPVVATPAIDKQHEIEKAADEAAQFQTDFKAKSKAAQEQAFVGLDAPGDTPAVVEATELAKAAGTTWPCPNGHDTVNVLTSRKGRTYSMCSTCHQFEH